MRRTLITLLVLLVAAGAAFYGFVVSGRYNVAADVPHTSLVEGVLERIRVRSIRHHARVVATPTDLADDERVRRGAGNYDSMCVGCHLAPGVAGSELSRGLYPRPPNLSSGPTMAPAEAFWVIRHGIKASGMPSWGYSMDDAYIWDMVALLQVLPGLSAEGYRDLVDASPGHSHGGGEGLDREDHDEDEDEEQDHDHDRHDHDEDDGSHSH